MTPEIACTLKNPCKFTDRFPEIFLKPTTVQITKLTVLRGCNLF